MYNISFYGSHNAAYVVECNGTIQFVAELERWLNYKNSGLAQYRTPRADAILFFAKWFPKTIMKRLGIEKFDNCYYLNTDVITDQKYHLETFIPANNYIHGFHHRSHASGCFYQSPYQEAIVVSFDGGGNDGFFNIYHATRKEGVQLLQKIDQDLGFPYMVIGQYLNDIRFMDISEGNLVYPGKIMGLVSYGKVRSEWVEPFKTFCLSNPGGKDNNYIQKIETLGKSIGVNFEVSNRFSGQIAYDVAATLQKAWEDVFIDIILPHTSSKLPLCVTGGCALNILLNTRLKRDYCPLFFSDVFIGPNPNDCGIATGLMLDALKPEYPADLTYSGLFLLDPNLLPDCIQNLDKNIFVKDLDLNELATVLVEGKIIGVARDRAEHGPRALGNRSIFCNPSIPEMKSILNAKVKHREWYRPFAPVVRLEDVSTYFDWEEESRWMSFCPTVKPEWREKLAAITHVDNTARVQTVTREQNEWLYDLLTLFKEKTGIGVLLNTSFNVDGKPILSTVRDAFYILDRTQMDGIVIEDCLIIKH